jgi:hypothetical protein
MRSTRFSDVSFITLSAMSWVLRDKVELKRGKQYACCAVVMCINSQKIFVAHWIDWTWARFGDEKKG